MIERAFEVGTDGAGSVVVNHLHLPKDSRGIGHVTMTPEQARTFGVALRNKAATADQERLNIGIMSKAARSVT